MNPAEADRVVLVAATRAVTDRTLVSRGAPSEETLTLCSSGLFIHRSDAAANAAEGTWTIRVSSGGRPCASRSRTR